MEKTKEGKLLGNALWVAALVGGFVALSQGNNRAGIVLTTVELANLIKLNIEARWLKITLGLLVFLVGSYLLIYDWGVFR